MSIYRAGAVCVGLVICLHVPAHAASSETAKADSARKTPLQRCDQLKDKAELDCLQKARERIIETRQKREAKDSKAPITPVAAPDAAKTKPADRPSR